MASSAGATGTTPRPGLVVPVSTSSVVVKAMPVTTAVAVVVPKTETPVSVKGSVPSKGNGQDGSSGSASMSVSLEVVTPRLEHQLPVVSTSASFVPVAVSTPISTRQ